MAEVFISYAREDKDFVLRLHEALNKMGRKDWVDWNDIPPTAKWMKEIQSAIESSDSFIFVISPDSLSSDVCHRELQYAVRHHKRLIPIVLRDSDNDKAVPEMLAKYPGTANMRKKFVTDTLQPLEELVKLNERGSEFLRELATNYRLLGSILIELNELNEAQKAFQKSAESCSELIVQSPHEALYHRDLAVSHYNIGVIFERQKKLAEANREYMAAYEPAKKAAEPDPDRWKEFFDDVESKIIKRK